VVTLYENARRPTDSRALHVEALTTRAPHVGAFYAPRMSHSIN